MKPIEAYIVSMLNQMAKMRQPLCVSELWKRVIKYDHG